MSRTDHHRIVARLVGPAGPELTCERCFEELDRYVELQLAGARADEQISGMRAHLEGCPACAEDHESLIAFVSAQGRAATSPPPPGAEAG
jgi:anti-sigma factor RsiW